MSNVPEERTFSKLGMAAESNTTPHSPATHKGFS